MRDGRAPVPLNEDTSRVMRANKAKDTLPEISLRKAIWKRGIRGYRLHWKNVPGRPDIAFPVKKIAVFVNGCFWHRCPYCRPQLPKSHKAFWRRKFANNVRRDRAKARLLRRAGWRVLTVWECQLQRDLPRWASRVKGLVSGPEGQ